MNEIVSQNLLAEVFLANASSVLSASCACHIAYCVVLKALAQVSVCGELLRVCGLQKPCCGLHHPSCPGLKDSCTLGKIRSRQLLHLAAAWDKSMHHPQ